MYEGKHIHFSAQDSKPLCSYSGKLCKQRRLNGYAFCIRHILEDRSSPFKQCAHVAKYNNQKCTNPIPSNENREYCNSHMQVAGMVPKKERKLKVQDGKVKFADRLKALLKTGNSDVSGDELAASVDDPYAFPEPLLDGAATPDKSPSMSPPSQDASLKPICDQSPSLRLEVSKPNVGSVDNKTVNKLQTPKSSKTMNRLQAKIAQNRILDKIKKSQESSLNVCSPISATELSLKCADSIHSKADGYLQGVSVDCGGVGKTCVQNVRTSSSDNYSQRLANDDCQRQPSQSVPSPSDSVSVQQPQRCSGLVRILPNKSWTVERKLRPSLPPTLLRVQQVQEDHHQLKSDLYPLGLELSDTDCNSDSEPESVQRHWLYFTDDELHLRIDENTECESRGEKLSWLKMQTRRQIQVLHKSQSASRRERNFQHAYVRALVSSARQYPSRTATLLDGIMAPAVPPKQLVDPLRNPKKSICCYQNEKEKCVYTALPYTRHCIKHIMYNVDQQLFEHCTAKFADNTQCCVPVFDICHELPLCAEHARKRDNYNRMCSESKPKKPRKKTKHSALTRPTKRGKKKKRQSRPRSGRHSSIATAGPAATASAAASIPADASPSSTALLMDAAHLSPGPTELHPDDISKDLGEHLDPDMEHDLDDAQLSPGSIEKTLDLPLDTAELANQASRLLEEHDFTDVLNKIPDDAFNDLFAESKNGDFLPTKEETEELERALAAVDKDVKSLEKLSEAETNDIVQLADSMELLQTEHMDEESALNNLSATELSSLSRVLSQMPTEACTSGLHLLPANLVLGPQAFAQGNDTIAISMPPPLRPGQWLINPGTSDHLHFQNGFPLLSSPATQPFHQHLSLANLKVPLVPDDQLSYATLDHNHSQTFGATLNGTLPSTQPTHNNFPTTDSPKETVS